jgi:SNF2 family DNA or RNA helicase
MGVTQAAVRRVGDWQDWQEDLAAQLGGLDNGLTGYRRLCDRVAEGSAVTPARSALVDEALSVLSRPGFDTFVCLPRLRFEPFDYQLRAAERALEHMRGRGILADEVGLGKTIEAALVLSELHLRGFARRVLVVVPAGLVEQWREELDRKFALPSVVAAGRGWEDDAAPIVLASLQAARRKPLRQALEERDWDLVIFDEAHRLKNPRSASSRFARALTTRYLLLLTATPVHNRLEDLFQLVSLVRPGHLGTVREFRSRHGTGGGEVGDLPALKTALRDVMVRHRRSDLEVLLPGRLARTLAVEPDADEADLYRQVAGRVRLEGRAASPQRRLALRTALRLAGSSPRALAPTLVKLGWEDLAARADGVSRTRKAEVLLELLERHRRAGEKVVVFTGFRDTLAYLGDVLADADVPRAVYHGSLTRRQKEAAVDSFREAAPVLLTTEAAGEGRNLQFCHVMVNFDLPWNPMQIEQRLGRIHRIGQDHEVLLYNLVGRGTIEERILTVLEAKISLFELVVGELDMILGRIDDDFDLPSWVYDTHVGSRDDHEFRTRMDQLGDDLAAARRGYLDSRHGTDALVDGGLAEDGDRS